MARPVQYAREAAKMNDPVDEPSLRARLLNGAKWSVALRLVTQTYKWVVTLLMVRLLTPQDYGLSAMLEAPIELLTLVGTLGIDAAMVRFGIRDTKALAAAFGWLLLTHALIFVALFVGAPWFAAYFQAPPLEPLIRVAAVVFVLAPFRVLPNTLLDMNLDFKIKSQVELKATVVATLAGLGLALLGAGVWALVAVSVLTAILSAGLLAWYRPWFVRPTLDLSSARPLITYGATILIGSIVTLLAGKVLSFLGGPTLGPELLGLFVVASLFSYLPINKTMPIVQQTLYPAFAHLAGDSALVRKYILNAIELCFITVVPVAFGMAAVAEPLVGTIFGPRWQAAALPLALLSLLTPLRLLNLLSRAPLNATGNADAVTGMAVLNLVLMVVGVPLAAPHGLAGLCILAAGATLLLAIGSQTMTARRLGLRHRDLAAVIWRPLVVSAFLGSAAYVAVSASPAWPTGLRLGAGVICGAVAYLVGLQFLMGNRVRQLWAVLRNRPQPSKVST